MRVGLGYDSHRFAEGRKLMLGGVEIPGARGLAGHSDADVLIHALIDALLGAAALGDIGQLFPDTDERYAGADSLKLLSAVCAHLRSHGWEIVNTDATIVAQRPKLMPYIPEMRSRLAAAMGVPEGCVRLNEAKLRRAVALLDERGIDRGRAFLLSRLTGEYREVPL